MRNIALATVFGLAFSVNASATLIASYEFDGNANDSSGNSHHGTINGATLTTDRLGNPNSAYSFDGNDFIWIGDIQTQHITLSAWFQTSSSSRMGIARWRLYGYGIFLNDQSIGDVSGFLYNDPSNKNILNVNQGLNDDNWHHVALTFDGLQNKLYLDGQLTSSTTASATNSSIFYGTGGLGFGRDGDSSNSYFVGSIDDISIYSNALSDSEIQNLAGVPSVPAPSAAWLLGAGLIGLVGMRKKSKKYV